MGEPSPICPRCGFQLSACSEILGNTAPALDFLLDPGTILPEGTAEQLAPAYKKLQGRFPQVSLTLCFVELNPPLKVNELAFWLMNVAPNPSHERAWCIVVVFDVARFEVGLAPGYGIEPFLKPKAWAELLERAALSAHQGDWPTTLKTAIEDMIPLLEEAKRDTIARARRAAAHKP